MASHTVNWTAEPALKGSEERGRSERGEDEGGDEDNDHWSTGVPPETCGFDHKPREDPSEALSSPAVVALLSPRFEVSLRARPALSKDASNNFALEFSDVNILGRWGTPDPPIMERIGLSSTPCRRRCVRFGGQVLLNG